jgi:DNA-binding transcriptional ArsR family regulator
MKEGPSIAEVAALMGDPARANMLGALMSGRALTAGELAREASITAQTASGHLAKLREAGLLLVEAQGRHRYFRLSGTDVAQVLEGLMGIASRTGRLRTRTGPRDPEMRRSRVCYDHMAGEWAVRLFEGFVASGRLAASESGCSLTPAGRAFFIAEGIDLAALEKARRPLCRTCLDWSERRSHLGGALGKAVLDLAMAKGWARRSPTSRTLAVTPPGHIAFQAWLREETDAVSLRRAAAETFGHRKG